MKLSFFLLTLLPTLLGAVSPGQLDDFEDGSTQGWSEGGVSPNPPFNSAGGGPAGASDNYLSNMANGTASGGRLVQFNTAQWAGDYSGIGSIRFHAKNFDVGSGLNLRVAIDGLGGRFCTSASAALAPGGWQQFSLSIQAGDFVSVGGSDIAATLASVTVLRILSSSAPVFNGGDLVLGTMGLDNIEALAAPTPTQTPTFSDSPTSTESFTQTPTSTATSSFSPSPTASNTPTPSPSFTASPLATATATPTQTLSHTASPSQTDSPTISPTHTATPSPSATPTPVVRIIDIIGYSFSPSEVTISAGTILHWHDLQFGHNIAQSNAPADDLWNGGFRSGTISAVAVYDRAFNTPGDLYYLCEAHSVVGMKGTVHVLPPGTPIATPTLGPSGSLKPPSGSGALALTRVLPLANPMPRGKTLLMVELLGNAERFEIDAYSAGYNLISRQSVTGPAGPGFNYLPLDTSSFPVGAARLRVKALAGRYSSSLITQILVLP